MFEKEDITLRHKQIEELWRICFPYKNEDLVRLYFDEINSPDYNIYIAQEDHVASSLQLFPYRMTFGDYMKKIAVLSGCCTHPDYQGQGYMHQLIRLSLEKSSTIGVPLTCIIPTTPELTKICNDLGFATVFGYKKWIYRRAKSSEDYSANAEAPENPIPAPETFYKKSASNTDLSGQIYGFTSRMLAKRPCCIQHTLADLQRMQKVMALTNARCCVSAISVDDNEEANTNDTLPASTADDNRHQNFDLPANKILLGATSFVFPSDDHWVVDDIFCIHPDMLCPTLQSICESLGEDEIEVRLPAHSIASMTPLGMARIIDAYQLLKLYAAAHPEADECLAVTDPLLPQNNGIYLIANGQCLKSDNTSLHIEHVLSLSIAELALWVFSEDVPHMSLMRCLL